MASAMVRGLLRKKLMAAVELACTSANDGTGKALAEQTGIGYFESWPALLKDVDAVVLACKPQQLKSIDPMVKDWTNGCLVVSILAGIRLERLCNVFPKARNLVRAMPNTPGQIGAGISAFASKQTLNASDQGLIKGILGSLGEVLPIAEEHLDAVTALSGSGPAYVFEFIAALRDGGIQVGLEAEVAYRLAAQTVLGAARLLVEGDESPEALRAIVTSPGGTTFAGLEMMEQQGFRSVIGSAIQAAKERSIELSAQA